MTSPLLLADSLRKFGSFFPILSPKTSPKAQKEVCNTLYQLNAPKKTDLQKLEKQGNAMDSNTAEGAQGSAVYKGYALNKDGTLRNQYAEKASKLPRTEEARLLRSELKAQTRAKMTPFGKALSEMADKNPSRQARLKNLGSKTAAEIAASARKTSPVWNKIGTASKFVGRGLLVVGVGVSAYNIATAPEGQRTKVVVEEASTWGGALAGGAACAKIGAAIGTFITPGLGTAVGAAVGGIVGGIGGAIAGSSIGKSIASWF